MSEIAGISECMLCHEKFVGPVAAVIGKPHGRLMQYLEKLTKHYIEKHPKEYSFAFLKANEFLGFLVMLNYKTSDPEIHKQRDLTRWWLHQLTLNGRISDDAIKEEAKKFAVELTDIFYSAIVGDVPEYLRIARPHILEGVQTRIAEVVTGLRRDLQEPDRYIFTPAGAEEARKPAL